MIATTGYSTSTGTSSEEFNLSPVHVRVLHLINEKRNSPLAARRSHTVMAFFLLVSQLWSCADKIRLLVLIILKGVVGTNLEYRHVYRFAVSILLPTTTSTGST